MSQTNRCCSISCHFAET